MITKNNTHFISKASVVLAALSLSLTTSLYAFEAEEVAKTADPIEYSISDSSIITVPVMKGALVFANLTDEMPAVVNYFTSDEEEAIIKFYKETYGEIVSQVDEYGRLTLSFEQEGKKIRVAITQQNEQRQVDIIVE